VRQPAAAFAELINTGIKAKATASCRKAPFGRAFRKNYAALAEMAALPCLIPGSAQAHKGNNCFAQKGIFPFAITAIKNDLHKQARSC
jgi:hypothetical protein